jgi:hypothetical protein
MDAVGKITLGKPMEGKYVTNGIPHMEKPNVLGMVVEEPIPLMDGKEEVKETPPIALGDEGMGPPMLDETLTPNIG